MQATQGLPVSASCLQLLIVMLLDGLHRLHLAEITCMQAACQHKLGACTSSARCPGNNVWSITSVVLKGCGCTVEWGTAALLHLETTYLAAAAASLPAAAHEPPTQHCNRQKSSSPQ